MFDLSIGSYLWPIVVFVGLMGLLAVVGFGVFAFLAFRKPASTPTVPPVIEQHLAAKRLATIVAEADLHAADKAVLDGVAAKLEPTPITREGLQALLAEQLSKEPPK